MVRAGAIAALLLVAGCAGQEERIAEAQQQELSSLTERRTPGTPVDCLPTGSSVRAVGGALVGVDGSRLWVNDNERSCARGGVDPVVIVETRTGGQGACRNDLFRTLTRGTSIAGPRCRIGAWTPYTKG